MSRLIFLVLAAWFLSGCQSAPQKPEDCAKIDWANRGADWGASAFPLESSLAKAIAACVSLGGPVDRAAFERGWQHAISSACTTRRGLWLGRQGRSYGGACPPTLVADIQRAFDFGRVIRAGDKDRDQAEHELRQALDVAKDNKKSDADRRSARLQVELHQASRDAAAARVSALEAQAAQNGWGIGR